MGEKKGKRRMTWLQSYIWPWYVGDPVWCVRSLPAWHPSGTAPTGAWPAADGGDRT